MPRCFSSARMASLGLRPYFSSIAASLDFFSIAEESFDDRICFFLTLGLGYLHCGQSQLLGSDDLHNGCSPNRGFSRQRRAYSWLGAMAAVRVLIKGC